MFTPQPAYKMVPQSSDSDDEVLYAASPIDLQQCSSGDEDKFGTGVYNRDLRLNLHSPRVTLKVKKSKRQQHLLCSAVLCAVVMVIAVGLGITIVVYAQVYLNLDNLSIQSNPSLCISPPQPLQNNRNGCKDFKLSPTTDGISSMVTEDASPTSIGKTEDHTTDFNVDVSSSKVTPAAPLQVTSETGAMTTAPVTSVSEPEPGPITSDAVPEPGPITSDAVPEPGPITSVGGPEPTSGGSITQGTLSHPTFGPVDTKTGKPSVADPTSSLLQDEDSISHTTVKSLRGVYWSKTFFPSVSECTLQLYDMNRDGIVDVVTISVIDQCTANVVAMDGVTGNIVWETVVNFPVFSLRCELDVNRDGVMDCIATGRFGGFTALDGINGSVLWIVDRTLTFPGYNFFFPLIVDDLDLDGVPDLINTHGGDTVYAEYEVERSPGYLVAVSGRTGGKLMEPILTPDGRETYMSPVLFKVGKSELIVFGTGGETVPGSLWAVSMGSIRTRIHKYKFGHSSVYVADKIDLEHHCTVNRSYLDSIRPTFDVSAFDFHRVVNSRDSSFLKFCPKVNEIRPIWNLYEVCLYELLRSKFKGMILPPVIVDLDGDEVDDLLVSTFDNHIVAYSGLDLTTLWFKYYAGSESYSIPTPLFYSEDHLPDILVRINYGEWADYSSSTLRLLDGKDRSELWSVDSTLSGMMSSISIAADSYGKDAMLFITIGEDKLPDSKVRVRRHGSDVPHSHKGKELVEPDDLWTPNSPADIFPNPDDDLDGFMQYCGLSVALLSAKLYLVDRAMVERGMDIRPIALQTPFVYRGPLLKANSSHNIFKRQTDSIDPSSFTTSPSTPPQWVTPPHPQSEENEPPTNVNTNHQSVENVNDDDKDDDEDDVHFILRTRQDFRCSRILAPTMIPTTPTIGDLNGDGSLEVSFSTVWENIDRQTTPSQMNVRTFTLEDQFVAVYGEGVIDFQRFLPSESQPWSRYMGASGNNVYHAHRNSRNT